jgi:hypothetical protein
MPPIISGVKGLIRAGISTLETDKDIREAIKIIEKHGSKNPFGSKYILFNAKDLFRFFDYISRNNIDLDIVPIENIVNKI